jgi:FKBP-type peptidyl-prolyl cis-trans isomerase SlyD
MRIQSPCVVSLTWTLSTASNQPIDELKTPVPFLVGGNDLLAKVEQALTGHEAGDELHLQLEPEHAFGEYRAELVCFEDRKLFPDQLEAGMAFEGLPAGAVTPGMPADGIYIVTEIYPSHVVLDGNHPLAGMALRLRITVVDVREARGDEIDAGSAGPGLVSLLDAAALRGDGPMH